MARSSSRKSAATVDSRKLVRPALRGIQPYLPGEQPRIRGLIKLNTNENPYPPSAKVLRAVAAATDGRLRLYPNATADPLRERLAEFHGCKVENIIVGNGSDELLAMAIRCFVEPGTSEGKSGSKSRVQYFSPSYSLYSVLAEIHGGECHPVPLPADFDIPDVAGLRRGRRWDFSAALSLVTTPNAPSGRGYSTSQLDELCAATSGVVVLDEAYVDFAREHAMELAMKHSHVLAARTFSKSYSLCFLRVGYMVGNAVLIDALHRIRDSYNVNGLGQAAAVATIEDLPYYRRNIRRVIATRERMAKELAGLGFEVLPSEANFLFVTPPRFPAQRWLELFREAKILVRWFARPGIDHRLRISVGTDAEADALLKAARRALSLKS